MKKPLTGNLAAASLAVVAGAALIAAGCSSTSTPRSTTTSTATTTTAAAAPAGAQGKATIEPRSGSNVSGWATFTERSTGGVAVVVHIENAPPGTHGLHVHEKGDCSAADASSAGGHFNPGGNPHAGPTDMHRHAGDLGNITIEANGTGHLEIVTDLLTVRPGPNSVVGKAVVFHEKEDDLKTQPSGNAGARLGCGVVQ
jgi:superoxide dismutase, Cu-Zn family